MNVTALDKKCDKCKGNLVASIGSAAHAAEELDIVVQCLGKCKRMLNTFIRIDSLIEVLEMPIRPVTRGRKAGKK